MRLLKDSPCDGPTNMASDEALLEYSEEVTLRLYNWQPACLSLGLFQRFEQVASQAPQGVPFVRRITGGGTIYHINEVTYSIVGQLGQNGFPHRLRDAYPLIHGAIQERLAVHGATLKAQPETIGDRRYHDEVRCFASPAADDLVSDEGSKALGSAGRNRDGKFLIHGSLKLATNDWDNQVAIGCGVDEATAQNCIVEAFEQISGVSCQVGARTPTEVNGAEKILQARYGDDQWVVNRIGPRP